MKAFAKVNLFLKILKRQDNGLHEIASRFCLLDDYFDEVFLLRRQDAQSWDGKSVAEFCANFSARGGKLFECGGAFSERASKKLLDFLPLQPGECVPNALCDRLLLQQNCLANFYAPNNLVDKIINHLPSSAAAEFRENFVVVILKSIPIFAGLGGGSADAAALLRLLVAQSFLSADAAWQIAPKIGADVPFFYSGCKCANVGGIGEIIEPIEDILPPVNLHFSQPCSTALVFSEFASAPRYFAGKSALFALKNREISSLRPEFANDLLPAVLRIYTLSEKFRAPNMFLSGSGGCFFTICNNEQNENNYQIKEKA